MSTLSPHYLGSGGVTISIQELRFGAMILYPKFDILLSTVGNSISSLVGYYPNTSGVLPAEVLAAVSSK